MVSMSVLRASIKAADALAEKAVHRHAEQRDAADAYATAADAYKSALAQAIRGTPRGSREALHCMLRMARLLRILGRYEEAAKAFGAYMALDVCVVVAYERLACVLQRRMPALYADLVRAYAKTTYMMAIPLEGADAFLVRFPWTPVSGGGSLCAADGLLPSLMKAWSACEEEYGSAAIAAMTSERLVPLRDTAALRRAADAAVLEGRWERATELLHEIIGSAVSPADVLQAIADAADARYRQGRFKEAHAAASALGPRAPETVQAAATDAAKAMCAEVAAASHMRSWRADALPAGVAARASMCMQLAIHMVYGTGLSPTYTMHVAQYVLLPTDDGWVGAAVDCLSMNSGRWAVPTGEPSTHALQRCNDARMAELEGEWSDAAELWEEALAKMCTPAVLRGVKCVDLSSQLCVHLMACPALSPAEQAAICDAWLLGYDRPEPLSLEALVAGRTAFGDAVASDADILAAILDRRDACAYGPHP
jgi:tetratricopeptide (TPR) repeat protein